MINKKNFQVKIGDKEVMLSTIRPTPAIEQKSNLVYAKAFADFLKAGAILKAKLDSVIRDQKIWDDEKQNQLIELSTRLVENRKLVEGKISGTPLNKAKLAAIQMRQDRMTIQGLISEKTSLESNTVEGQAEQVKFNYLVSACTVYSDTGNNVFKSVEDYLERSDEAAIKAAAEFAMLYYEYDPDSEKKLPENEFLVKYKFCDDKLRYINVDGHYVDSENRLIDENGRFIDKDGKFVDINGKPVTEGGESLEQTFPFTDDEGKALIDNKTVEVSIVVS